MFLLIFTLFNLPKWQRYFNTSNVFINPFDTFELLSFDYNFNTSNVFINLGKTGQGTAPLHLFQYI